MLSPWSCTYDSFAVRQMACHPDLVLRSKTSKYVQTEEEAVCRLCHDTVSPSKSKHLRWTTRTVVVHIRPKTRSCRNVIICSIESASLSICLGTKSLPSVGETDTSVPHQVADQNRLPTGSRVSRVSYRADHRLASRSGRVWGGKEVEEARYLGKA